MFKRGVLIMGNKEDWEELEKWNQEKQEENKKQYFEILDLIENKM